MNTHSLVRILSSASLVGGLTLTGLATTTSLASTAGATGIAGDGATAAVCVGVTNCHAVDSADVDGDGRSDQVGWRQLNDSYVQIRVHTATGKLLVARVDVRLWFGGGAWAGAARVDDHAGAELLVGSMQGAHTPMYTMLTYRGGRLVDEESPSPLSPLWQIDSADGDYMGWWRHTTAGGAIAMTQKIAVRIGTGDRFRGHDVTYVWSKDAWVRTSSSRTTYATGEQASVIAGFHVPGLKAFPGIR
jgi:hypothetical protein